MDVISYKCPNCGAPVEFAIETQRWDCHFCDSSFTKEEMDRFAANEAVANPAPPSPEQDAGLVTYSCPNCGGEVLTDSNTTATFCAYCHNPTVIASRLSGVFRPAQIVPFTVPKDQVIAELRTIYKRRFLLPKLFKDCIEKGEVTGLYAPFWLYDATLDSRLSATGLRVTSWSDSQYNYTKTDTYDVQRAGNVPFRRLPVSASQKLDSTLMDSLEPFDYGRMQPFAMEYLSGHFAENYDMDAEKSQPRFEVRARQTALDTLRNTVMGYNSVRVRDFIATSQNLLAQYTLLPVWTISVQYRGEIYTFAMNGQTGKSAGKLPVQASKALLFFLALFAGVSAIAIVVGLWLGGYWG